MPPLTAEQKAKIERNRQAALLKKNKSQHQQKQHQQHHYEHQQKEHQQHLYASMQQHLQRKQQFDTKPFSDAPKIDPMARAEKNRLAALERRRLSCPKTSVTHDFLSPPQQYHSSPNSHKEQALQSRRVTSSPLAQYISQDHGQGRSSNFSSQSQQNVVFSGQPTSSSSAAPPQPSSSHSRWERDADALRAAHPSHAFSSSVRNPRPNSHPGFTELGHNDHQTSQQFDYCDTSVRQHEQAPMLLEDIPNQPIPGEACNFMNQTCEVPPVSSRRQIDVQQQQQRMYCSSVETTCQGNLKRQPIVDNEEPLHPSKRICDSTADNPLGNHCSRSSCFVNSQHQDIRETWVCMDCPEKPTWRWQRKKCKQCKIGRDEMLAKTYNEDNMMSNDGHAELIEKGVIDLTDDTSAMDNEKTWTTSLVDLTEISTMKADIEWTVEEDNDLWKNFKMPVNELAERFLCDCNSIKKRQEYLRNPSNRRPIKKSSKKKAAGASMKQGKLPWAASPRTSTSTSTSMKQGKLPWAASPRTSTSTSTSKASLSESIASSSTSLRKVKYQVPKMPDEPSLSAEQQEILRMAVDGYSIFFTGNAGTGKSTLLRFIIKVLKVQHGADKVAVTASTGAAATLLGGTTIHSFSGVGIGRDDANTLADRVSKNKQSKKRWLQTKILIVDEVSMLEPELFDKLDFISRKVRKREGLPFGGVQLILVGDFFQLPPVKKGAAPKYCFEAKAWTKAVKRAVVLKQVFRQKNEEFVDILNEVRTANLSEASVAKLEEAKHHTLLSEPTRLFAHNARADAMNRSRLAELPGASRSFHAEDSGEQPFKDSLAKHCQVPALIELKIGTPIILLKNLDVECGLCNGTRGTVVDFETPDNEDGISSLSEMALDELEKNPKVEFVQPDGKTLTRRIDREEFSIETAGRTVATRSQLPLKLAWAISIHKSQGLSIDCLEVDLSGCFEYGQCYVALSRATSFENLKILNFQRGMVKAHPKVISFYQQLYSAP